MLRHAALRRRDPGGADPAASRHGRWLRRTRGGGAAARAALADPVTMASTASTNASFLYMIPVSRQQEFTPAEARTMASRPPAHSADLQIPGTHSIDLLTLSDKPCGGAVPVIRSEYS